MDGVVSFKHTSWPRVLAVTKSMLGGPDASATSTTITGGVGSRGALATLSTNSPRLSKAPASVEIRKKEEGSQTHREGADFDSLFNGVASELEKLSQSTLRICAESTSHFIGTPCVQDFPEHHAPAILLPCVLFPPFKHPPSARAGAEIWAVHSWTLRAGLPVFALSCADLLHTREMLMTFSQIYQMQVLEAMPRGRAWDRRRLVCLATLLFTGSRNERAASWMRVR